MDRNNKNIKPGDNEIVTKKGFLISLPQKKNNKNAKFAETAEAPENRQNNTKENKNYRKGNNRKGKIPDAKDKAERTSGRADEKNQTSNANKNAENFRDKKNKHTDNRRPNKNQLAQGPRRGNFGQSQTPSSQRPEKGAAENFSGNAKNRGERPQKNHQNRRSSGNERIEEGTIRRQGKKKSILSNIEGYSAVASELKNENYLEGRGLSAGEKKEIEEKPDYSKMPSLREQILGEGKEKRAVAFAEAGDAPNLTREVIGIRFREAGKIYYFDPDGKKVDFGTPVIVETARGVEYGYTAISNRFVPETEIVVPLKKILRIATDDDNLRLAANKQMEAQAEKVWREKTEKLGLDMTLIGTEYTFDNSKLMFYFSAEGRIDFRELVKELAGVFRTRIELRQVGVRDEAKHYGGLGVCGRELCCKGFLGEFIQVSIKMAKDQNLSLNSSKISGTCGRLLCCLRYEDEVYQQEYKKTPKVDAIVDTEKGRGVVVEALPLKGIVKVLLDADKDAPAQAFNRDEVTVVGYSKNKKPEDAALEDELKELEKE